MEDVFSVVPLALEKKSVPHNGREVENKARHEEGGNEREEIREEGDGLAENPRERRNGSQDGNPGDPALGSVDKSDDGVLVESYMNITGSDRVADGARQR